MSLAPSAPEPDRAESSGRSVRAAPLPAEERRAALVSATLSLVRRHGLAVTTRQIAESSGVAEGTIFRVFSSKDELVDEALRAAFDPMPLIDALRAIDRSLAFEDRLVELVRRLQAHFTSIFETMAAAHLVEPPPGMHHSSEHAHSVHLASQVARDLLAGDEDQFRLPLDEVMRIIRLLTFSGSHPGISHQRRLSPEEIVDVVLDGVRRRAGQPAPTANTASAVPDKETSR